MKPELLFDVRLQERNVTRGRTTQAELDQHLKDLVDVSANAENLEQALGDRGTLPVSPAKVPAAKKPGK